MDVIANPLLPGIVRVVFGGAFMVVAAFFWLAILGHLRSGKVQLPRSLVFDRQQQPVDYWITIAFAGFVSLGAIALGASLALGRLPVSTRRAPAGVESTSPKVDGLILPTPRQAMPESAKSHPPAAQSPTTPRAPQSP
ncbi:MAG: hypothetical protein U0836_23010 [Pirellulales bacterium]